MGKVFGEFKYNIGDVIKDSSRELEIIGRYYVNKEKKKNGKTYSSNEKWYKYKCLKCGNEDSVIEYSLHSQNCGCNACCVPPRKIVKGINDISTTAPWMVRYISDDEYITNNAKYSKVKTKMVCPDCGRVHMKSALNVYANHGLSCPCSDNWSYPNKFMYAVLEDANIHFQAEKIFDWSLGKIYDDYIEYNGKTIIIEMQGAQHFDRCISEKSRTLKEEKENDSLKMEIALNNGIDYYFQIDARKSDCIFLKESIIDSGLLNVLNVSDDDINWSKCDEIATSNHYRTISEYHESMPYLSVEEIAKHFNTNMSHVMKAVKAGLKFGWCSKSFTETKRIREQHGLVEHGQKPIYCVTDGKYFNSAQSACDYYYRMTNELHNHRALRKSISRNTNYKGKKFIFISREEFNKEDTYD